VADTRSWSQRFALGVEALKRFVHGEPLCRVHERVFAALALEREPDDSHPGTMLAAGADGPAMAVCTNPS